MAFSEYAMAVGDEQRLKKAQKLLRLLVQYQNNPALLPPKIYPQTRSTRSQAMSMILLCVARQMRKTGIDFLYDELIDNSLREIFEYFMKYDEKVLLETVGPNGERLDNPKGRCVNPGHAIETAWFIMEEYRHRKAPELLEKGCLILDWSLDIG
jgi:N-acylglucosamine 2-epimerase